MSLLKYKSVEPKINVHQNVILSDNKNILVCFPAWHSNCQFCQLTHYCQFDTSGALYKGMAEFKRLTGILGRSGVSIDEPLWLALWRLLILHLGWPSHITQESLNSMMEEMIFGAFGLGSLGVHSLHSLLVVNCRYINVIPSLLFNSDGITGGCNDILNNDALRDTFCRLDSGYVPEACANMLPIYMRCYDRVFVNRILKSNDLKKLQVQLNSGGRLLSATSSKTAVIIKKHNETFSSTSVIRPQSCGSGIISPVSLKCLAFKRLVLLVDLTGNHKESCNDCQYRYSPVLEKLRQALENLRSGSGRLRDLQIVSEVGNDDHMNGVLFKNISRCNFLVFGSNNISTSVSRAIVKERQQCLQETVRLFDSKMLESVRRHYSSPSIPLSNSEEWTIQDDISVLAARLTSDIRAFYLLLRFIKALGSGSLVMALKMENFYDRIHNMAVLGLLSWNKFDTRSDINQFLSEDSRSEEGFLKLLRHSLHRKFHILESLPRQHSCSSPPISYGIDNDIFLEEVRRLNNQIPSFHSGKDIVDFLTFRFFDDAQYLGVSQTIGEEREAVIQQIYNPLTYLRSILCHLIDEEYYDLDCIIEGVSVAHVFG